MRTISVTRTCNVLFAVLLLSALSGGFASAQPGPYIYTTVNINNPVPGVSFTRPVGLNDVGSLAGTFETPKSGEPCIIPGAGTKAGDLHILR